MNELRKINCLLMVGIEPRPIRHHARALPVMLPDHFLNIRSLYPYLVSTLYNVESKLPPLQYSTVSFPKRIFALSRERSCCWFKRLRLLAATQQILKPRYFLPLNRVLLILDSSHKSSRFKINYSSRKNILLFGQLIIYWGKIFIFLTLRKYFLLQETYIILVE